MNYVIYIYGSILSWWHADVDGALDPWFYVYCFWWGGVVCFRQLENPSCAPDSLKKWKGGNKNLLPFVRKSEFQVLKCVYQNSSMAWLFCQEKYNWSY